MRLLRCIVAGAAATVVASSLAGCASVTEGSTQPISIATAPVSGATCTLSNAVGKWTLVTPGTAIVAKSQTVLKIVCVKDGGQEGTGYLTPRVPASALIGMMMPYAGVVSAAVDGSTGAGNEYPDSLLINMKENVPLAPPAAQK